MFSRLALPPSHWWSIFSSVGAVPGASWPPSSSRRDDRRGWRRRAPRAPRVDPLPRSPDGSSASPRYGRPCCSSARSPSGGPGGSPVGGPGRHVAGTAVQSLGSAGGGGRVSSSSASSFSSRSCRRSPTRARVGAGRHDLAPSAGRANSREVNRRSQPARLRVGAMLEASQLSRLYPPRPRTPRAC